MYTSRDNYTSETLQNRVGWILLPQCEHKYHRRTQQWPYQFDIEPAFRVCVCVRVARLCVLLVLSGGDAGVCLSTCCAYSPRACLSLSTWGLGGPQVSGKITPMLGSDPKDANAPLDSLLRLVVGRRKLSTRRWWSEHNAPAGGFSTSIVQSSGQTGRRDLAPHPHEKPSRERNILSCLV